MILGPILGRFCERETHDFANEAQGEIFCGLFFTAAERQEILSNMWSSTGQKIRGVTLLQSSLHRLETFPLPRARDFTRKLFCAACDSTCTY